MLHVMRDLAKLDENGLRELVTRLDAIREKLFRSDSIEVVVTCEDSMVETLKGHLTNFVNALPKPQSGGAGRIAVKPAPLDAAREARTAPMPVAFNVRIFKTVRYQHPDA